MVIDGGRSGDGADSGAGADTSTGESALGSSDTGVPARIDAGGGYLARARAEAGVNWLLLVPLVVFAILLAPRVRARLVR